MTGPVNDPPPSGPGRVVAPYTPGPTDPPPPPPPNPGLPKPPPPYQVGVATATCPITWPGHTGCAKAPTPHSVHRCSCGAVHIHSLAQSADQPLTSGAYLAEVNRRHLLAWLARSEPRLTITGSAS